jgi:hypothetical protein
MIHRIYRVLCGNPKPSVYRNTSTSTHDDSSKQRNLQLNVVAFSSDKNDYMENEFRRMQLTCGLL